MPIVVAPCGLHPLGMFSLAAYEQASSPRIFLADDIDPLTQDLAGLLESADVVDQMVLMALSAIRGTIVGSSTGQLFGEIRKLSDSVEIEIRTEAETALQGLIRRGLIQIDRIAVLLGSDWFEVQVRYFNLRLPKNKQEQTAVVRAPIGSATL